MNLYDILIENKDSTIKNVIDFPTFDLMNIDNLSKILAELSPLPTSAKPAGLGPTSTPSPPQSWFDKNKIFIERMNDELLFLLKIKSLSNMLNISIDRLQFSLNKRALSYMVESKDSEYSNYLRSSFSLENALITAETIRYKIKNTLNKLNNSNLAYESFLAEYRTTIEKDTILNKRNKEIKEAYSMANQSINKIYSSIDAGKVYAIFNPLTLLENNNHREYVSLPMQQKSDMTDLIIKIVPKKNEYGLSHYQSELQFPTYKNSYLGIGMAYYISTLYNDAFSFTSTIVDTVTSYNIVDEHSLHSEIGIATLLYYGKRFKNSKFGYNFTIGPAFSISNKIKPRLTTGVGLSCGKKQMFMIGFMLMAGYVDRLSNAYSIIRTGSAIPENITVSKLRYGFAGSLGYIYKF